MSDSLSEERSEIAEAAAPVRYERPTLTKVGNVRELLAGEGGTVADVDPTLGSPLQASPEG